jgi:O-succinylbenzoate synthase
VTRLVGVTHREVRWPIEPRGAARGTWSERSAVIVGVHGEHATGLGEAAPLPGMSIDRVADAIAACTDLAACVPIIVEAPNEATEIADRLTAAPAARFAIETALLRALAQSRRTSIAGLWGAVGPAPLHSAVVVDDEGEARAAVAAGAPCLKIKADHPDRVLRIAAAVPGVRLRVDANRGWPRAEVERWLGMLAALPIEFVEEPCLEAHQLLARSLPCRLALDESLIALDPGELARAIASPSLAALILKPTLLGGFARCHELAALARRHDVAAIVTHTLEGPIGTAACGELARSIRSAVPSGLAPHPGLERFFEYG